MASFCCTSRRGQLACKSWEEIKVSRRTTLIMEILVRVALLVVFCFWDISPPTHGAMIIQPENMWRHRFPQKDSQVPFGTLLILIAIAATIIFYVLGIKSKRRPREKTSAILGITMSVLLTSVMTNIIKSSVGRPRPNYLVRCYGESFLQVQDASVPCTVADDHHGDRSKSFPSGHTSAAFAGFLYLSLYIAGKLGTFSPRGRGSGWRLVITVLPTFFATWVGVTRIVDYCHHVEDVIAGGVLGTIVAFLSYSCYFKSLTSENSHEPVAWKNTQNQMQSANEPQVNRDRRNSHLVNLMNPRIGETSLEKTNGSVKAVSYTTGKFNVDIQITRNRSSQVSLENSDANLLIPRARIAFYYKDIEDEFLNEEEQFQAMREELVQALDNLQKTAQEDGANLIE